MFAGGHRDPSVGDAHDLLNAPASLRIDCDSIFYVVSEMALSGVILLFQTEPGYGAFPSTGFSQGFLNTPLLQW